MMMHPKTHRCAFVLTGLLAIVLAVPAQAAPVARSVTWLKSFDAACRIAKQKDRLVLAYFSGSDWEPYCQKLQKEVLSSDNFIKWVDANVIPFNCDFPGNNKQDLFKKQNEDLKTRFQVSVVPMFLLLDNDGEVVARFSYDQVKLQENEPVGKPVAAIEFLDNALKNKPDQEKLLVQPSLAAAVDYAKAHKLPVLFLLTRPDPAKPPTPMHKEADKLVDLQRFIRWANINVSFYKAKWPDPSDKTEDATLVKGLIEKFKLGPADAQMVLYVPGEAGFRSRTLAWNTTELKPLMTKLQKDLPLIEYRGIDWLNDVRLARAIMSQQPKRAMFLYFTDGSEFCQKLETEILKTEEFSGWPFHAFVLVKLDYSKGADRPKWLEDQNKGQADLYGIRGYPYCILVNPKGQKIGEAKYMKGGPKTFLAELKKVYDKDTERRLLTGQDEVIATPPTRD
ncbi:MAG TPA: thioredoxin fold domain-containing protein [Tepidisphaeraceae bacterium]|nr:thioredoxin fold domain-containing protein [Tepidisphaeraceae bacterium]